MTTANDKKPSEVLAIEDGMTLDYLTNNPIKETPKELVRQKTLRALFHEYGISAEDMELDVKVKIDGKQKKIDIAIFEHGADHIPENIRRIVICDKEPKKGKKSAVKMRDHDQAHKDLQLMEDMMREQVGDKYVLEKCQWGLWTNGIEFFFVEKEESRFDTKFNAVGDWPLADETLGSRDVASNAQLRTADREMLLTAFRRCHNFIHGNEGMPKDAAFWQFLYLIFSKMYDERIGNRDREFWASPTEQFDDEGRKKIRTRINPLFEKVKKAYPEIFTGNEEITLSDRALAFMVSELAKYDFTRTEMDAKGAAYQEVVGDNLRGDRGQYFTPRGAIKLIVEMMAPQPHEKVLDPSCGTGGFLEQTLSFINRKLCEEEEVKLGAETTEEFISIQQQIKKFAENNLFGCDFDPFLCRASQMNVVMASNAMANIYHMNSLEYPHGHLKGVEPAKSKIPVGDSSGKDGSIDVILTNPPFGSDIPVTDKQILEQFDLAYIWECTENGGFRKTERRKDAVSPEILFIERCVQWLKQGGRMGIVLPDGILGNPGDEYIRWWLMQECWVLGCVDLPVESFIVEANVNILTSLLFLKKKTDTEKDAIAIGGEPEYPVFMAVAEKVGFDRRGNTLYERHPDGEEKVIEEEVEERIRINGHNVVRKLKRRSKILDDDLPKIAKAWKEFRANNPEPSV
ncbi:methylation-associated defense system DNA methyltransferase MAD2 [Vibrio anguillarum]|nr:N-6 DNA methylase [Vibrio anguillarum]ATC56750.1 restriction endonuclease subunit M [Vibrio anguillarum]MBF4252116.1 restriction endonuclease subunit M [Vibrio anguillarum]MBF4387916.1 restriction endonuclease subunit M [Vibrio anguillarum]MBF4403763.1 restriction endonuclease subunit M [Vibrio anguillarum]